MDKDGPDLTPTGNCFQAAADWIVHARLFDTTSYTFYLVHGEVTGQGRLEGVKYGHAWVEWTDEHNCDWVHDPTLDLTIPRRLYYRIARVDHEDPNVHRYDYKLMTEYMLGSGHYGPWDLATESGL